MELKLLGNADLLLRMDGVSLLFDAFHEEFSGYPSTLAGAWDIEARCLLYTHAHGDHFCPSLAREYLQAHPGCRAFGAQALLDALAGAGVPRAQLGLLRPGEPLMLGGLSLKALDTRHIGHGAAHVPHQSYLVEGSRRFLFAGDASPSRANFSGLGIGRLDCIAAPYAYAAIPSAQRMYDGSIETRGLLLLHSPPPGPLPERPYRIYRPALLESLHI